MEDKKNVDLEKKYGGMDPRDAELLSDEEKRELENESEADNAARVR